MKNIKNNLTRNSINDSRFSPKSRFRKLSLRVKRSNLAFSNEIATHLSGARNDRMAKGFLSLNRNLGFTSDLTMPLITVIWKSNLGMGKTTILKTIK